MTTVVCNSVGAVDCPSMLAMVADRPKTPKDSINKRDQRMLRSLDGSAWGQQTMMVGAKSRLHSLTLSVHSISLLGAAFFYFREFRFNPGRKISEIKIVQTTSDVFAVTVLH
jgi:hypothetical protein